MKRTRPNSILSLEYPQILFIVNDMGKGGGDEGEQQEIRAFLFQPFMGDECVRLVGKLRKDNSFARVFLHVMLTESTEACVARHDNSLDDCYTSLSQVCLTDTKKNRIGAIEEISMTDIHKVGAVRVEYICLFPPLEEIVTEQQPVAIVTSITNREESIPGAAAVRITHEEKEETASVEEGERRESHEIEADLPLPNEEKTPENSPTHNEPCVTFAPFLTIFPERKEIPLTTARAHIHYGYHRSSRFVSAQDQARRDLQSQRDRMVHRERTLHTQREHSPRSPLERDRIAVNQIGMDHYDGRQMEPHRRPVDSEDLRRRLNSL